MSQVYHLGAAHVVSKIMESSPEAPPSAMYRADEVRGANLEITTRCNARCPMCARNVSGGRTKDYLPLVELTLEDIRRVLPVNFVRQLEFLEACGSYGDALTASDTLEILSYLKTANQSIMLYMHTNGGGREPDWWRRLAGMLTRCRFGIDGLEDTNHLYRRGVSWSRLMTSVEAYMGAGGKATWDFLVFRHNEHQVEAARALSRRLGFSEFNVKKTSRFLVNGFPVPAKQVLDDEGRVEYLLEMPSTESDRNPGYTDLARAAAGGETYAQHLQTTLVRCEALRKHKIRISAEGLVFPCCWTANIYAQPPNEGETWRLIERLPGGVSALDARKLPIREIINGPYFQSLVPETWVPDSPARRRSSVCARTCGALNCCQKQQSIIPS